MLSPHKIVYYIRLFICFIVLKIFISYYFFVSYDLINSRLKANDLGEII